MKKIILLCLLFASTIFSNAITISTLDEQFSQNNQTVLRFKIENNSNDTLKEIELRYHVKQETARIAEPDLFYLPDGMANWSFEDSLNATLIIYFPNVILYPGDTLGGNSGFAIGLHNKNWSAWSKNDDLSQPTSNTFSIANNVEVLSNGKPLMLTAAKNAGCPVVQFVEVQKDSIALQILQKLDSDSSFITIKNKTGNFIQANLDDAKVDSLGQKIWHGNLSTQDSVERRGELFAECNGNILAYFAFGWKPEKAKTAVEMSLWESTDSFVKADFDMGFNQGLIQGQRLALKKDSLGKFLDARKIGNWKFYRTWESPDENPMPIILSPVLMQYSEDDIDSLTLEWNAVEGADYYHLVIVKDSLIGDSIVLGDTIVSEFTSQTIKRIPTLPVGNYLWFAEPLIEVSMDENEEGEEYYLIPADEPAENSSPLLRASWWKKVKKWAKKTVKKAVQTFAPVTYSIFYGGNFIENSWNSFKNRISPLGMIQIFVHVETLHTRTNKVTKNLTRLKDSYDEKYVYTAYPERIAQYLSHQCFGTDAFCAMKDTRMLAEKWKNGFNEKNWNKVFLKVDVDWKRKNSSVHNRCWLTMAQMINHYKGGDISEDEIMYEVREEFENINGGDFPLESMQAVKYVLGEDLWENMVYSSLIAEYHFRGIIPSVNGWYIGPPPLHGIIKNIELGNIIGVSQLNAGADGGHAMVLNGYKIQMNGDVYIHLLNVDNMGNSEWRYYCNISFLGLDIIGNAILNGIEHLIDILADTNISNDFFRAHYIPPLLAKGRSSNPSIFEDADSDGIVDFDEIERFKTNPSTNDSDGDGVNDFEEIYGFMKCTSGSNYMSNSDIDGDDLHAAIDVDSDGDGYCDSQESAYIESNKINSCERFDATRFPKNVIPSCKDYTVALLAKELLLLNDRASCVSLNGTYCPIASYNSDFSGAFGVGLGVKAKVGNVFSAKPVLLRDRAFVHGNLETANTIIKQSSTIKVAGSIIEHSPHENSTKQAYDNFFENTFDWNLDFEINNTRVLNSGENLTSGLLSYNFRKVDFNFNSGSSLILNVPGEFYAGALKFQKDSKLIPQTNGSVIFYVGNDFQWNGTIVADDMVSAAHHFMIYYYGTNPVYIQTEFAGTIIAPNAKVIVGQVGKNFYGAIYAKSIVVHQDTKVTWVPFLRETVNAVIAGVYN